ncbi:MAG: hypothetical protein HC830_09235, partial [Bacteroidetes bacterium]|nr:hypothetical protein [Bacteroidota bacterium]
MKKNFLFAIALFFGIAILSVDAQTTQPLVLNADKPIAEIQSTMWGIFFEDINFAADGG